MGQRIRIGKEDIEVVSINGAARYLNISVHELEHWIVNDLLDGIYHDHDGEDYQYLLDTTMLRQLKAYIDRCPRHWSHEKMLWYRYISTHIDEMREDLTVYRQFLENNERIHYYNAKRRKRNYEQ